MIHICKYNLNLIVDRPGWYPKLGGFGLLRPYFVDYMQVYWKEKGPKGTHVAEVDYCHRDLKDD